MPAYEVSPPELALATDVMPRSLHFYLTLDVDNVDLSL